LTSIITTTSGIPHVVVGATAGAFAVPHAVRPPEARASTGTSFHSTLI